MESESNRISPSHTDLGKFSRRSAEIFGVDPTTVKSTEIIEHAIVEDLYVEGDTAGRENEWVILNRPTGNSGHHTKGREFFVGQEVTVRTFDLRFPTTGASLTQSEILPLTPPTTAS